MTQQYSWAQAQTMPDSPYPVLDFASVAATATTPAPMPTHPPGYLFAWEPPPPATVIATPMSHRDGAIGLMVGLVLLATTLSGGIAMGFMNRQPAATVAVAPPVAAAALPPTAGTPGAGSAPPAEATPTVPTQPVPSSPAPVTPRAITHARRVGGGASAATLPTPTHSSATGTAHPSMTMPKPKVQATPKAATKPATATAPRPGRRPVHTATLPMPAPAIQAAPQPTPQAAPAPQPQVAPTPATPVSYSVSTPGGAHWVSAASEYANVVANVPNATLAPNYQ